MTLIIVDTEFLRSAGRAIIGVADGVRSAGSSAASAAAGAPSYDGQFGPKVRAIGSEAKSKAGSLASTLRDMGGNLVALAAAFEAVDLQTVEGLGALGPFVGPMPQIPDLNGDGVIDLADLAFYNPYLPFSDDQPFPSVTWAQSPSPVVMFLRGLKLNPLAGVIPFLPNPSFDDLSQAWQSLKAMWQSISRGDLSSAYWASVNAGLFAVSMHDEVVDSFLYDIEAIDRRAADWETIKSGGLGRDSLFAAGRLGYEGIALAMLGLGGGGVAPELPGGMLEGSLAQGGHLRSLQAVQLSTRFLGGDPTYDPQVLVAPVQRSMFPDLVPDRVFLPGGSTPTYPRVIDSHGQMLTPVDVSPIDSATARNYWIDVQPRGITPRQYPLGRQEYLVIDQDITLSFTSLERSAATIVDPNSPALHVVEVARQGEVVPNLEFIQGDWATATPAELRPTTLEEYLSTARPGEYLKIDSCRVLPGSRNFSTWAYHDGRVEFRGFITSWRSLRLAVQDPLFDLTPYYTP